MAKQKIMGALGAVLEQAKSQGSTANEGNGQGGAAAQFLTETPPKRYYPVKGNAKVPASMCRPWRYADRHDWEMGDLDRLAASIEEGGQLQPAVVRNIPAEPGSEVRYEVIAGRRRWETAMRRGGELEVLIRDLTDQQAFHAMVVENEDRKDLCDYTRGVRFKRALADRLYSDQAELAAKLRVPKASLSKLLRIADLDPAVVQAFSSPAVLTLNLGYLLVQACEQGYRDQIIRDAAKIESGAIAVRDIPAVWGGSSAPAPAPDPAPAADDAVSQPKPRVEDLRDEKGRRLGQLRVSGRVPVLRLTKELVPTPEFIEDLKKVLARHLRRKGRG